MYTGLWAFFLLLDKTGQEVHMTVTVGPSLRPHQNLIPPTLGMSRLLSPVPHSAPFAFSPHSLVSRSHTLVHWSPSLCAPNLPEAPTQVSTAHLSGLGVEPDLRAFVNPRLSLGCKTGSCVTVGIFRNCLRRVVFTLRWLAGIWLNYIDWYHWKS